MLRPGDSSSYCRATDPDERRERLGEGPREKTGAVDERAPSEQVRTRRSR
jgi:hypothetical protein